MTWTQTRNDIIHRALRILGVVTQGDIPSAEQFSEGVIALNSLIKSLQTEGIKLFYTQWISRNLTASSKVVGTDNVVYECSRSHTSTVNDKPITGNNYNTYWRQTTDDVTTANIWLVNTSYSCIGDFDLPENTLDVMKMYVRDGSNDIGIELIGYEKYLSLSDKRDTYSNYPTYAWVDKKTIPHIYLYPRPSNLDVILNYFAEIAMPSLDHPDSDTGYYERAYDMLVYNLAVNLSDEYAIPIGERNYLFQRAERFKYNFKADDCEDIDNVMIRGAYSRR